MERPDERTLSPEAKEYISYLENRLENMSAMYKNLQKAHFGSKSEKQRKDILPEDCEQLSIFNEAEDTADAKAKDPTANPEPAIEVARYCYKYVVFDGVLYDAINRWLLHAPDITLLGIDHLNLPEGLLCIDNYAFEDCPNISYLQIPDSVITIGEDAFKGCSNLTLLVYPESYAAKYAMATGIPFSYILKDDPSDTYLFE